ncbi:hypothetical protein N665_0553s0001 [Sinapis alba]|nr:hypothetical protein N665_0553s0001 [Sinapis alba]
MLFLYIAVSPTAVNSVLIKQDRGKQKPIFNTSKQMTDPETQYPTLEKMALAVVTSARKLRPYFQSHSIEVLTNHPLSTVMKNTNQSRQLSKCVIKLSEHDITYKNRVAAKSQVLADFLIELSPELEKDLVLPSPNWILHINGSATNKGSGPGAEYESLIAGLRLASAVKEKRVSAYCDCQLVVSQYSGNYDTRNDRMNAYLKVVQDLARKFDFFELIKVPRGENVCIAALAALGSKLHDQVKRTISIHRIDKSSIELASSTPEQHYYMTPVHATDYHPTHNSDDTEESSLGPLCSIIFPTERSPKKNGKHAGSKSKALITSLWMVFCTDGPRTKSS